MADLIPSRRRMLGLIAAAPAVALVPVAANATPPDRKAWDAAWTEYQRLNAAWLAHEYARTCPTHPSYRRLEEDEGVLMDRACQALDVVMALPAPDHAALADKLVLYGREFGNASDLDAIVAMAADVRRLVRIGA